MTQTGDTSVVESCDFEGQDRYSAVMLTGSEVTALTAWRGLLVMADINHQQVMLHSLTTNITRRLWPGSVTSLTVFAQRCQTPDTSVTGQSSPPVAPSDPETFRHNQLYNKVYMFQIIIFEVMFIKTVRETSVKPET